MNEFFENECDRTARSTIRPVDFDDAEQQLIIGHEQRPLARPVFSTVARRCRRSGRQRLIADRVRSKASFAGSCCDIQWEVFVELVSHRVAVRLCPLAQAQRHKQGTL